jgi:hypothetical protein
VKKQVSPMVIVISLVVVVGAVAALGYRALNPKRDLEVSPNATKIRMMQMQQNQSGDPRKNPNATQAGNGQAPPQRGGYGQRR